MVGAVLPGIEARRDTRLAVPARRAGAAALASFDAGQHRNAGAGRGLSANREKQFDAHDPLPPAAVSPSRVSGDAPERRRGIDRGIPPDRRGSIAGHRTQPMAETYLEAAQFLLPNAGHY